MSNLHEIEFTDFLVLQNIIPRIFILSDDEYLAKTSRVREYLGTESLQTEKHDTIARQREEDEKANNNKRHIHSKTQFLKKMTLDRSKTR